MAADSQDPMPSLHRSGNNKPDDSHDHETSWLDKARGYETFAIREYYRLLPPMKLRRSEVAGTSLSETGVK